MNTNKPFSKLRGAMTERGIDQVYLARYLDCGRSYITSRINAERPWTMDDCYRVLDLIGGRPDEVYEYFPPEGRRQ